MENLTEIEFQRLKADAYKRPFSPFAKFCQQCKGFDFYQRNGKKLDRWELWLMGYRDVSTILKGYDKIIASPKKSE